MTRQAPAFKLKQRHANRQRGAKYDGPRAKSSHYRTRVRASEWAQS